MVTGLAEMLSEERRLCDHIDRCILSEDEMADGASPLLRDIRRKISQQTEAARMRIHAMISSSANKGLLQDDIVTMRDGRFVIPVKQENIAFPGDYSRQVFQRRDIIYRAAGRRKYEQ